MEQEFNFDAHKEQAPASVAELNHLCESMFKLRAEIDDKQAEISTMNVRLEEMKAKVQGILDETGLTSFKSTYGTVGTREINTYKIAPEGKAEFIQFLRSQGMDQMLSVNHQTLQAYCREVYEQNKDNLDFSLPGVGEPQLFKTITMRKG